MHISQYEVLTLKKKYKDVTSDLKLNLSIWKFIENIPSE